MDQQHYKRIDDLREQLANELAEAEKTRDQLHGAIRDAFPEAHGQEPKRGVLAEVSRRAGYSREHVAQIRDGKA